MSRQDEQIVREEINNASGEGGGGEGAATQKL